MTTDGSRSRALRLAGWLVVAAVVLAVVGLIVRVVRWLLILAAIVLVAIAVAQWLRERGSADRS